MRESLSSIHATIGVGVGVEPVTLMLPVPLKVRGLMFAKVEPRLGAPTPLKVLSATLLFEIVIVIVPSADIEPESAAPSGKGLLASGSGLIGESGGPICPYSKDGVPVASVFMATYFRRSFPKSQMTYH